MSFLIARPYNKAIETQAVFVEHGLAASVLPAISISMSDDPLLVNKLNKVAPQVIILTSTYAADWLCKVMFKQKLSFDIAQSTITCVGNSTASIIKSAASNLCIYIAQPENSEGLLALPCLTEVHNQSIALIKGKAGRELLEKTICERKAQLEIFDVYQRYQNIEAIQSFTFEQSTIQCMIATSSEIIDALLNNIDHPTIKTMQWIVVSERIKDYAISRGLYHVHVSKGASNQALLACAQQLVNTGVLNGWFKKVTS